MVGYYAVTPKVRSCDIKSAQILPRSVIRLSSKRHELLFFMNAVRTYVTTEKYQVAIHV